MDLRQLEIFSAVAKYNNFSQAAKKLHLAQPAVSIAIKKLEQELGLTLFHRPTNKQISLTPEGATLLNHASSMLAQKQTAIRQMRELKNLQRGEVHIAMPAMYGSYFFPALLSQFKAQHPHLQINVIEAGTREVKRQLLEGECELGVVLANMADENLITEPLVKQQMLACVGPKHPLSQQQQVCFQEFIQYPLILTRKGYFMRETIDTLCQEFAVKPNICVQSNLMMLTKKLLMDNQSVSTCMSVVLDNESDLIGIPFEPNIHFDMALAWKKDSYLSNANQTFADFLLNQTS